jgi:hypothetical protein
VAAGVMSAVTLNAWWCQHCNEDHDELCPRTGCNEWGAYMGFLEEAQRQQTRVQERKEGSMSYGCRPGDEPHSFHIIGRTTDGNSVRQYDGSKSMHADLNGREIEVRNIGGLFLFRTNDFRVFSDGKDKLYDSQGNLLPVIGRTIDGYDVYRHISDDDEDLYGDFAFRQEYFARLGADFLQREVIQRKKDGQFLRFGFYQLVEGKQFFGTPDTPTGWVDKDGNDVEF